MKYTDAQLWELRKKYNPFENCEFENKMLRVLLLNNYQIEVLFSYLLFKKTYSAIIIGI